MPAITALINVMGRIVLVLLEAQIRMVFALGQALGAGIAALWQKSLGGNAPSVRRRTRRNRRPRRRYASNRR